jgi:O-antigen/teichoic acid export membrane protein
MSKFVSNVITLFSATMLGQILGIIASPVLSRLYSPVDFGIAQLFFSIVSLIGIVACLSYQSAINLPRKDTDAANIVVLCLALILVTAVFSAVILIIFSKTIEDGLHAPDLTPFLFLIPFAIIVHSAAFVLGSWLSRRKQFSTNAQANLVSSITGKATSISWGLLSPNPFGLIFGTIINDATIIIVSVKRILGDLSLFKEISYEKMRELAIRYKKFPQFSAISSLTSVASTQSIPFMLAFSFSPMIVGFYAMTYTIINLPLKLMANSLVSVFYQKACEEKNRSGSIVHIVKPVHTRLISIGMFTCLLLMIIGPELFTFVLGAQWATAGLYAQILAPWFFVVFISTPISSIFSVFEKQGASLGFNLALLISRIIIVIIGGFLGDPLICMVLLSVTGVIFWTWMNMYLLRTVGISVQDGVKEILRFLILALIISLPLLIVKLLSLSSLLLFSTAIVVTMVYYLIIVYQDPQLQEGIIHFLNNILPKKNER